MAKSKKQIRIWTATKDAAAGFMVTPRSTTMAANRKNFITATPNGVVLAGDSVVSATVSENFREGGLFVRMNDLTQMVPTTLVTPMPNHVPFVPTGLASDILKDMEFFTAIANGI